MSHCIDIQRHIEIRSCPPYEILSAGGNKIIEEHMLSCKTCQDRLHQKPTYIDKLLTKELSTALPTTKQQPTIGSICRIKRSATSMNKVAIFKAWYNPPMVIILPYTFPNKDRVSVAMIHHFPSLKSSNELELPTVGYLPCVVECWNIFETWRHNLEEIYRISVKDAAVLKMISHKVINKRITNDSKILRQLDKKVAEFYSTEN